jgi:hypothetical protein
MKFHTLIVSRQHSSENDRDFEVIFCALRNVGNACVSFFA